ncbi:unnamed protein product [Polarella glacialis]|nr:unnamed protein product [Polarella glacialis]
MTPSGLPGCAGAASAFESRDVGQEEASAVELAVIWVRKATKGSTQWVDSCPKSQLVQYQCRKRLKPLMVFVKYGYLALALFEEPSWCLGSVSCVMEGLYSWHLPVLPFFVSNTLETLCLLVFAHRWWIRRRSMGAGGVHGLWHLSAILLVLIALPDCIVSVFNVSGIVPGSFRLCRLCRPLIFLCFTKSVRSTVDRLLLASRYFWSIIAALALCVMFFVWIGIIAFTNTDEGGSQFESWFDAIASLWILFTTANYPDVMIPAYNQSRGSFVFFFVYLVISHYLLNNILLAAVYDAYKDQMKATMQKVYQNRRTSVDKAFALLSEDLGEGEEEPYVTLEKWGNFFSAHCDSMLRGASAEVKAYNAEQGLQAFRALDADGSNALDSDEFHLVVGVMADPQVYVPRRPLPEVARTGWGKRLARLFSKGIKVRGHQIRWDALVDVVILIEVLLTFAQTVVFVSGGFRDEPLLPGQVWFRLLSGTTVFFALEVSLKMCVLGPERFWNRQPVQHRFDLCSVSCLVAIELTCLFASPPPDLLVRGLVLAHVARTVRLAQHVRPFSFLATLVVRLLPVYQQQGLLLFLVYYIFTTLGEQLFGGLIKEGDPKLKGSGFDDGMYWSLNFNDFPSGFVTLFVLMVVNNWQVVSDGFMRVTSKWAASFFVSFFVVANLVVLNILMALILDSSAEVHEELQQAVLAGAAGQGVLTFSSNQHSRREFVLQRLLLNDEERRDAAAPAGLSSPASMTGSRRMTVASVPTQIASGTDARLEPLRE